MKTLTVERARELLDYDPETGLLTWKISRPKAKKGAIAGGKAPQGFVQLGVDGGNYKAHRVIWLLVHGVWPPDQIDHKNGVKDDNRLVNLREATDSLNRENVRKPYANNNSGLLGVHWDQHRRRFTAILRKNGRTINLGRYLSKEEAHAAYLQAKRKLHAGCTI